MAFFNRIQKLWQCREERRRLERRDRRLEPRRNLYGLETLEPRLLLAGDALLTPIALEVMAAPCTEAVVVFGQPSDAAVFDSPVIDDAGNVSFVASSIDPGIRTTQNAANHSPSAPSAGASSLNPTAKEQLMLELMNRMRQDPAAELPLLINSDDEEVNNALDFFNVNFDVLTDQWSKLVPSPPLAWNEALYNAARDHSELMQQHDQQSHQLPGEPNLSQRIIAAGYNDFAFLGENIFAFSENVFHGHAGFAIDWGTDIPDDGDGIQKTHGHRNNLMNDDFREIGIGIIEDPDPTTDVGPLLVTQDFGDRFNLGNPFLLGVVFDDNDNNDFYSEGEGLGLINVDIAGANGTFNTMTMTAGGYQIQIPAGTYNVQFSGGALPTTIIKQVTIGSDNTKLDLDLDETPQIEFSTANYSVNESAGKATLTLIRTGDSSIPVSVTLTTSNGTALDGSDYTTTSQSLGFAVGETSKSFDVIPIVDDDEQEASETINLQLSNPGGGALLGDLINATLTILDNEPLPGAIFGVVFDDQDGDSLLGTGEPGRPGLTVHLSQILPDGSEGNKTTTTTDAKGQYSFDQILSGNYRVSLDTLVGPLATTPLTTNVEVQNDAVLVSFFGQLPAGDPRIEVIERTLAFGFALMDFGDAPDPTYPTLLLFDGARHSLLPGLRLGKTIDTEEDGKPSEDALSDSGDDGVTFGSLKLGESAHTTVNVMLPMGMNSAKLDAWLDWNADGNWDDEAERIAKSLTVIAGDNLLDINVPATAQIGLTFARVRLSIDGTSEPSGLGGGGEVEDYQIEINPLSVTIGTGANKAFIYTDGDGTTTTTTLKGGTATVFFSGDNIQEQLSSKGVTVTGQNIEITEIILADTATSSSLTFTTKGGDGFSSVGKISGDDPLGKLTGKGIDLVGEGIAMTGEGFINTIDIHGTQNGADLILPGTGSAGITVKAGRLGAGTDINLGSGLKSLTATEWLGSSLTAPWASKITISSDFGADLILSGSSSVVQTLGTLTVKGNIQGAHWDIVGNVGKVSVTGTMDNVEMRVTGNMTSLTTGALRHSTVFAGLKDGVEGLPASLNDFVEVVAEIKTLTIKGISGSTEPSFVDSRIAARNLGKVSLKDIKADNKGIAFGFAADKITSYTRDKTKLSKLDTPGELDKQGDYIIRIL